MLCPVQGVWERSVSASKSQGTPACARVCVHGPFGRTLPSGLCSCPQTRQALLSVWDGCPHQAGAFFCLAFYFFSNSLCKLD